MILEKYIGNFINILNEFYVGKHTNFNKSYFYADIEGFYVKKDTTCKKFNIYWL